MYQLVNSSTPFRLCNIFAFFYFLDEVLYSVVWIERKSMHGAVFTIRLLDTAQSSDTHPKTIRTHFCRFSPCVPPCFRFRAGCGYMKIRSIPPSSSASSASYLSHRQCSVHAVAGLPWQAAATDRWIMDVIRLGIRFRYVSISPSP